MPDFHSEKITQTPPRRVDVGIKSESFPPTVETVKEPRLSNDELQRQIQESAEATREVDRLAETRAKAAEYDVLTKEQAKRIAITQAVVLYDERKADLVQEGKEIKAEVAEVNKEIASLEPQLIELANKFAAVQRRIFAHYKRSQQASQEKFYAGGYDYDPNKPAIAQPQPNYLGDWLSIIGDDSKLKTISPYSKDRLIEIVLQKVQAAIYLNSQQLKELSKFKGW